MMPAARLIAFLTTAALLVGAAPAYAQGTEPAGGAAVGQVVIATAGASLLTVALLVLGMGHRSGRIALLGRGAAFAERVSGLPGWAALPSGSPRRRCSPPCSGCTGTSRCTSTSAATRGRWPTPRTTSSSPACSGSSAPASSPMVLPKERPERDRDADQRATGTPRWAAC